MFDNLKLKIKELAKFAVIKAEETLGEKKGQQKKEMAINIIVSKIPVPNFMKVVISILFSSFIDDAIEIAVEYMNREAL